MLTKDDFKARIADLLPSYPTIAARHQAGDPQVTQHLDAVATMFAMYSTQLEVALLEPFEKARDATILADCAMRGIVHKATPARFMVAVTNKGSVAATVETGRVVVDSSGRMCLVETSATIQPGETETIEVTQKRIKEITHTVSGSAPFYAVEIPMEDDDESLSSISVSDSLGEWEYRYRYVNTAVAERVYHVEADDQQRVYLRFGANGLVGVQPANGSLLTLTVGYTFGEVSPDFGSPFSFEYLLAPAEATLEMSMQSLISAGQSPMSMAVMRDLARYPSVYDENAVYMGEFDFMVRRNFAGRLRYLSVWNEMAEEAARGPSEDNVNTLFVACLSKIGGETVLTGAPAPTVITSLTPTQEDIKAAIRLADDSYRVRFVTPVRSEIPMSISATVPNAFVASVVRAKIIEVILDRYGESSAASKRGFNRPRYQDVYALLKNKIDALQSSGSDLQVSITEADSADVRPELWRYVSATSLDVEVTLSTLVTPSWGS